MTTMISPAPVRRTVTVEASPQKAFDIFTARFDRWWPSAYQIGATPMKSAVIEPKAGGRWYEVGEDGAECQWGDVLAWEPPSRIVLAWRIRTALHAAWRFDPDLLTEVEVTFTPVGDGTTRVELEHRLLENLGEAGEAARAVFDSEHGWAGILQAFAQEARSVPMA